MAQLTILYDGGCPLCLREVRFLGQRDRRLHPDQPRLAFVDIDGPGFDPALHGGIDYRSAMARIHALSDDGAVLRDVEVFRRAYGLVGLGWLYAPSRWPLLRPLIDALYQLWASARLRLTGRPDLDSLCRERLPVTTLAEASARPGAGAPDLPTAELPLSGFSGIHCDSGRCPT
jgi:predicted DCC family thiol-disulfide oxidoreductase YuxK